MGHHHWSDRAPWSITTYGAGTTYAAGTACGTGTACGAGKPPPRRIVVLGPPGSGKSTLARHLGAWLGLPVFHLDQIYWQSGWAETPPEAFAAEVRRIAETDAWVMDGNYTGTIGPRLQAADTLIYLDIPAWLSVGRVMRRLVTGYGRVRPDMPAGCPERFDWRFLWFTATWNRERRARNLGYGADFRGRRIVLQGRRGARDFILQCKSTGMLPDQLLDTSS